LPPPWKTWWAYTLYILIILVIIIYYIWLQKQKLREKQQELEYEKAMAAKLKEADRLKDEFLANTSHELRTPLNGIIGIAESLIDGATGILGKATHTNLGMIVSSGRRLLNLVNDILDFSKLKKKDFDLQLKAVDIRTIAEVVLALSQPLIGHKKVELINAIDSNLPPINADENRIQQILYNLVGNAIKFTDSGTITVSTEVIMNNQLHEKQMSDSSLMPNAQLAITVYGGTGLGLAVTQQLVNLHDGQMNVQSQVGVGSDFSFTLPISEDKVTKPSSQLSVSHQSPFLETNTVELNYELTESDVQAKIDKIEKRDELISSKQVSSKLEGQFNILIVDDDLVNRQVLLNQLSLEKNYYLNQAASGLEALEFLEQGYQPDLILLDVMMPHLTGYEVTQKIRETKTPDELPIILLTAKNQVTDLVTGLESGANDYLTKPVSKYELLARIRTHLNLLQLKQARLEAEEKLRYDATHDQLTQLFNRKAFTTHLTAALEKIPNEPGKNEVTQFPIPFAVLFVDLDRFKIVNDSLGHFVGDQLLTKVAKRLNHIVSENDLVARFGGDEFAIILEKISDLTNLEQRVDSIQKHLSQAYQLKNEIFNTTASIGISICSGWKGIYVKP